MSLRISVAPEALARPRRKTSWRRGLVLTKEHFGGPCKVCGEAIIGRVVQGGELISEAEHAWHVRWGVGLSHQQCGPYGLMDTEAVEMVQKMDDYFMGRGPKPSNSDREKALELRLIKILGTRHVQATFFFTQLRALMRKP